MSNQRLLDLKFVNKEVADMMALDQAGAGGGTEPFTQIAPLQIQPA